MVSLLGFLPLVVGFALVGVLVMRTVDTRVDRVFAQLSRRYFGRYVSSEAPERRRRLKAAYVDETYRSYAAKSYFIAVVAGAAGLVIGAYVFGGIVLVLPFIGEFINQLPSTMAAALGRPELDPDLGELQVLLVMLAGGTVSGIAVGGIAHWLRWETPRSDAEVRRRGINEGLPRTVAFVYALSRGGMEIPTVLQTLADSKAVYGESAKEISVAVREMNLFGSDIVTAVRRVAERTPSDQFRTFSENLSSVLQSGQSLTEFLRDQYERYQEEAAERQSEVLELLATIAEAYVTIFVAGTLFLMTILLVFGLTTTSTINFIRMMAYALIPLGNVLFIIYLDGKLELLGIGHGTDVGTLRASLAERHQLPDPDVGVADGGVGKFDTDRRQLERYDSIRNVRSALGSPVQTATSSPVRTLYVTVPVAVVFVAVRTPAAFNAAGFNVRVFDDVLIQASLFVLVSFAVVWELYSRRISKIEAALPEFLDRLSSLNEAGMSVVESFDHVRDGDLGVLSTEIERVWRDIQYGANVHDALLRLGLRVRTTATTRAVTLLTNALKASGNIGPILDIAADQAQAEIRLRRRRRSQMLTYLVVIYISFLVFLVIILAVQEVLVPSLPNSVPTPSSQETSRLGVDAASVSRFGQVNKAAYTLVFFHTALIQAVTSGLIAGQLGEGSLKHGAKHAAVMLGVAYVAFLLISSPSAHIVFQNQEVDDGAIVVEQASLTEGGYVVVRENTAQGEVIGHSRYLAAGSHEDVRVPIDDSIASFSTIYVAPHLDTDGDETYGFSGDLNGTDRPYPGGLADISIPATVEPD